MDVTDTATATATATAAEPRGDYTASPRGMEPQSETSPETQPISAEPSRSHARTHTRMPAHTHSWLTVEVKERDLYSGYGETTPASTALTCEGSSAMSRPGAVFPTGP